MATFDGINLLITLDSGVNEVDLFDDIYEPWKDWLLSHPANRRFPQAFRSDGGNPLSSIINQGSYIFLNNAAGWRIKPPEEDITVYLTGNLAVEDTTLPALVPTDGAFTAAIISLQPVTQGVTPAMRDQLEFSAFDSRVCVDVVNGYDGTGSIGLNPIGTFRTPSKNFTDALTIAGNLGFTALFIKENASIPFGDYTDFTIIGQGQNLSSFYITSDANVTNVAFRDATVSGILDGDARITDSTIDGLVFISGLIENCVLNPATITLGGAALAQFNNCSSGVPGVATAIIDCGGTGQPLAMRGYNGGVKLINKTGTDAVSIDLASGQVRLDLTTVTNGEIVVRGVGKLVDDATGDEIVSGTYGSLTVVNETVSGIELQELWRIMGLDKGSPMTVTPSSRVAGNINQTITGDGTTTSTVTRT